MKKFYKWVVVPTVLVNIYILIPEAPGVITAKAGVMPAMEIIGSPFPDKNLSGEPANPKANLTPDYDDVIEGYPVTSVYGMRVHPVHGIGSMHRGTDLGTPEGTPIYAIGNSGDTITVSCWWDDYGGGNVIEQEASPAFQHYTFMSLHVKDNTCKPGTFKLGAEPIKIGETGNTGVGTGAHYHFGQKIFGLYVQPATKYIESALGGKPPKG